MDERVERADQPERPERASVVDVDSSRSRQSEERSHEGERINRLESADRFERSDRSESIDRPVTNLSVLTLTNYTEAPFFRQQQAALKDRGVSVTIRSVPGDIDAGTSRRPIDYCRFVPAVLSEARRGYDLVHAHYGLTAPMALAQLKLPVVLSVWGSDLYGPVGPVTRVCAPLCDEVIVMSNAMQADLRCSCTVIPDGVDLETFVPMDSKVARDAVGWTDDAYNVLFPYSSERTVKDYPRAHRITTVADELLDQPVCLHAVHGVAHDDVPTYMNAADALLLTSRSEGSPNVVKEALACNLPVVSLDVGDVRERLAGVSPSVVATSDDELLDGLCSVLQSGVRSNGRKAAREVGIDRTTEQLLDVYSRVT